MDRGSIPRISTIGRCRALSTYEPAGVERAGRSRGLRACAEGHDRHMDLSERHDFERGALDEHDLAADPFDQVRRWIADAAEVPEPNAMVVSTVEPDGAPSSRTVLLRGLDTGFVFYTHRTSAKGRALAHLAEASLLFPWYGLQRQIIVAGHVEHTTDDEDDAYFASRPWRSQVSARASDQSQPIVSRAALEAAMDAEIAAHPEGSPVPRPHEWGGYRVIPRTIEFWQGRRSRLHDRLRFERDGDGWRVVRLQP